VCFKREDAALIAGRITHFDNDTGRGVIRRDDDGTDIPVRRRQMLPHSGPIPVGLKVQFELVEGCQGEEAVKVRPVANPLMVRVLARSTVSGSVQ
jgi:cold shock CspA family protein